MIEMVRAAAAPHGLNLVAAIPAQHYNHGAAPAMRTTAIAPEGRSIIVVGNGGGAFWRAFIKHVRGNPGWRERDNPLDDFTRAIIEDEVAASIRRRGSNCATVYPFMNGGATLNFMELAKAAGLSGPSIIGVNVHPVYGPWIAFRAALLVAEEIDAPGAAAGFNPCPRCTTRACISACPANAVSFPAGWDIPRCLEHRVEVEPDCAARCHARVGCVLGPEHRYTDDELAYHQERALRAMRAYYFTHVKPGRAQ
ncbi:MAG: hypothetical protein ACREQN_01965 [Candidatus Binataceae bacterium]